MIKQSLRLNSLDALRGFSMLWIMETEHLVHYLSRATDLPLFNFMSSQLHHAAWNGFTFYDLIFPLFIFVAGVSTPYSIGRSLEKGISKNDLLLRIIKRGLILIILGIIYNNGLELRPLEEIRFPSVLGRIGMAYMFSSIIYLYTTQRTQFIWFGAILIGYWILLLTTAAPGFQLGDLSMEGNFASYLDRLIIPGRLHKGIHDPEGLITSIPAICTGLLGIYAGNLLRKSNLTKKRIALYFVVIGIVFIALANLWNLILPINKNLWTSSFVLQTGGLSFILLALFYYIIDIAEYKKWAFFLKIIGMNSILIYMSKCFIDWTFTSEAFFKWLVQLFADPWSIVVLSTCTLMVQLLFLYFMYSKKLFLKI